MFTTKKEGNSCEMQIIWVPQGFSCYNRTNQDTYKVCIIVHVFEG